MLALAGCTVIRIDARDCVPDVRIDFGLIVIHSCKGDDGG
jgi:hypothetical protein